MNKRGFVLLHVLVLSMIVAVITAGVVRMVLMNAMATQRAITGGKNHKESDAVLNRAVTYWNATGTVCATIPGVPCVPASVASPGACNCTCTSATGAVIVVTDQDVVPGPPCNINIVSSDP